MQTKFIEQYLELFCHRRDIYAVQKSDGSYFLVHETITLELLRRHLTGEITCGWYALMPDNTVRWVACDADRDDGLVVLQQVWRQLNQLEIAAYLEKSRRGGHLWVFMEPLSAAMARTLMKQVLSSLEIGNIEIYPRQDDLTIDGVGSLLRGPFGIHQLTNERYGFLDPVHMIPIGFSQAEQFECLLTFRINSSFKIQKALTELGTRVPKPAPAPYQRTRTQKGFKKGDKVRELKEAIGDLYTFVSAYVQLDAKGRGSCPFHPPDRHPSFAINCEQGYWICFHEINPKTGRYLGGDAIEFYCRLKGISFNEAARELTREYGLTHLNF